MSAVAYAAISGLGSLVGSRSKRRAQRRERNRKARQFGIRAAGIEFATMRMTALLPTQAAAIQTNKELAAMTVDKNQAKAEADARVNAAAAGVAGASVENVVSDTERTAAQNKDILNRMKNKEMAQLEISLVDKQLNAEINKGVLIDSDSAGGSKERMYDVATAGLTFLSSYLSKI